MKIINLEQVIRDHNIGYFDLVDNLFPGTKHPCAALARLLEDPARLRADQVASLADIAGVPVSELYTNQPKKQIHDKT